MWYRTVRSLHRRWSLWFLVLLLLIGFVPAAHAQSNARYFPETGHFIQGTFRTFWETNGGVLLFGYPITEEYVSSSSGRVVQYFERARFELVEQDGQTLVGLGHLGAELAALRGLEFVPVPAIEDTADRRYVEATEQIVQYGFKTIWERYGEERIFGYPISSEFLEETEDGVRRTVQYFERARFEYHPDRPDGERVLISTLGRLLAPAELTAPLPPEAVPGAPPETPTTPEPSEPAEPAPPAEPSLPPIPASINASVTPDSGPPGTTFLFDATGFEPGEQVGIWITAPDGSTFDAGLQGRANDAGSIIDDNIALETDDSFPDGIWSFNAEGVNSGNAAIGYFRIARTGTGGTPSPAPPAETGPDPTLPAPSFNNCGEDDNFANAKNFPVQIVTVDKAAEIVRLQNLGNEAIDLTGWRMCSIRNSQEHLGVTGALAPGEIRDIPYGGSGEIWNNDERDDGALYNSYGQLVSYWTDPT